MTNPENVIDRIIQILTTLVLTAGVIFVGMVFNALSSFGWVEACLGTVIGATYVGVLVTVWETELHNALFRLFR